VFGWLRRKLATLAGGTTCGTIRQVSKWEKLIASMRASPSNTRFRELCGLVVRLGFEFRGTTGSHRIYRHTTKRELFINLQSDSGGKAKPYQVRQVLDLIDGHHLSP
jgi:predicted RNA binding protein YcfA (HicA-like mRNA interferase family)